MPEDFITNFILVAGGVVFFYFLIFILFPIWTIISIVHHIVIMRKTKNMKKWKYSLLLGILPMILVVLLILLDMFFMNGIGTILILISNIASTVLFFIKE